MRQNDIGIICKLVISESESLSLIYFKPICHGAFKEFIANILGLDDELRQTDFNSDAYWHTCATDLCLLHRVYMSITIDLSQVHSSSVPFSLFTHYGGNSHAPLK